MAEALEALYERFDQERVEFLALPQHDDCLERPAVNTDHRHRSSILSDQPGSGLGLSLARALTPPSGKKQEARSTCTRMAASDSVTSG